jgi:hypothetical protein
MKFVMIDLTPRALLNRLQRGVVYERGKAERALQNFFREQTLVACASLLCGKPRMSRASYDRGEQTRRLPSDGSPVLPRNVTRFWPWSRRIQRLRW